MMLTTSQENVASVLTKTNNEYVNIISDSSTSIYEQTSPLISETDHILQNNVTKSLENELSTISYNEPSAAVQH